MLPDAGSSLDSSGDPRCPAHPQVSPWASALGRDGCTAAWYTVTVINEAKKQYFFSNSRRVLIKYCKPGVGPLFLERAREGKSEALQATWSLLNRPDLPL